MTSTSSPAAVASRRPAKRTTSSARTAVYGWSFVAPFAVIFIGFLAAPLVFAFWLSLRTRTLAQGVIFTGFDNYVRAFTDPAFLQGVWFVVKFSAVLIPFQMIVSLAAALVIDALATRLANFSRLMIFIPYAIPVVIGALMWGFLYSPRFGPIADISERIGVVAPYLLSPEWVFFGLMNIVTWQWAGYYMIIIYAALRGIDPAVYEAAKIDGANAWQIALRIKVPMISSAMVLILVFALIGTLQFFTEPQVLRSIAQGTINASFTPNMYAFSLAFSYDQINYASAISFALGIIVVIFSYAFMFVNRKRSGLSS
jgi:multiple sugar transport system permease protein